MKQRPRVIVAVLAAALALRLAFVLAAPFDLPGKSGPHALLFPDEREYHAIARNIMDAQVIRDARGRRASRAPGYPLFLAATYAVFGFRPLAARAVQACLGAAACIALMVLARRVFGEPAGTICGLMAAVYPFLIAYTALLLSETLFSLLLILGVLALDRAWRSTVETAEKPRAEWRAAVTAGVFLGLAVLVRSSLLLFPLFCAPFWLLAARRRHRALALGASAGGVMRIIQVPWVWRNYRVFGRFIPTTLQVGESLYEANGPGADGGPRMDRIDWVAERGGAPMSEFDNNAFFRAKAVKWIRERPAEFVRLAFIKLARFWNPVPNAPGYRSFKFVAAGLLFYVPVVGLAILGAVTAAVSWRRLVFILLPVLYYSCLHMVFVGSIRYRTPVMPFVMVFSACGAQWLWERIAGKRPGPAGRA